MLRNSNYKRQIPVGIGSFPQLVEKHKIEKVFLYHFVDKTAVLRLFMTELLTESGPGNSMLIIRPRRWGKTLFMSMMEAFFSNQAQGRELFRGLEIESLEGGRYMEEQGQYPVISLSLRDVSEKSFESFLIKLDLAIKGLYDRYKGVLLSSPHLDEDDKAEVTLMTRVRSSSADARGQETLENSLKELSHLLFKHFNKTVFILIDEYDAPLNGVYKNSLLVEEISDFMKKMLGAALKDNDYLRKGVMMGILRLSQSNMLSQLNNLKVYTSRSDEYFSPYFGFTEAEVVGLMERTGSAQHDLEAVKSFYNGYYLEGCTIYNPWAINNYLHSGQLKPYWVNSGNDNLLLELLKEVPLELKEELENLLEGKSSSVVVDTEDRVQFSELKKNEAAFWSFLLSTGYLTITSGKVVSLSRSLAGDRYCVRIPNEEIRHRFCTLFAQIMREKFKMTDKSSTHFIDMLFTGNTVGFANQLSIYLASCASYHDFPRESNYHTFMLGLVAHLTDDYFILSNMEAGDGRTDLIFIPKDIKKSEALIIELKHVKDEKLFKREAKNAIQQINDKRYAANITQHEHIHTVQCIGIAFYKKKSHVLAGKTFEIEFLFPDARKKRSSLMTHKRVLESRSEESVVETLDEDHTSLTKKKTFSSPQIKSFVSLWEGESDEALKAVLRKSKEEFLATKWTAFSQQVTAYGLDLVDVPGDGNCFFHALLAQLQSRHPELLPAILTRLRVMEPRVMDHADLRQFAVDRLLHAASSGQLAEVMDGINDYIEKMSQDRTWADGIVIPVLACALGITIVLLNSDGNKPTVIDGGNGGTVYLGYQVGVHFQSTIGEPNAQMLQEMPVRQAHASSHRMALRHSSAFFLPTLDKSLAVSDSSRQKRSQESRAWKQYIVSSIVLLLCIAIVYCVT